MSTSFSLPETKPLEAASPRFADFVALTKPRITAMVIITAAGGMCLAPPEVSAVTMVMLLIGMGLIVSGANALNMYLERDVDVHMVRTRKRPLPAGRMSPRTALWFGVAISIISVPILAIGVNATTALLGVLANVSYVLGYTPLKQRSHVALFVGAVPGAIPPLMGWTASTAHCDAGGLALFAILFFWQIPHFLAIALFRKEDYARAGLQVMPNVLGISATKQSIITHTGALVASTLLIFPLGIAGRGYLVTAFVLGCVFLGWASYGLRETSGNKWARSLFFYSIAYLVLLFIALAADARV
ncbi:heme o synthase [Pendulispora brunnea]|uniref:Protoheme IX farnesyltransferase n=1 Tax=Pendulispora brunnea TaxID=2905690 RepID=A0ABZ2KE49_9BACT